MHKFAFAAVALLVAGAAPTAFAAPAQGSQAKLVAPVDQPTKVIIDGRLWSCVGADCVATGQGKSQPIKRECVRVAKAIGPVASFTLQGQSLDAAGVAACNAEQQRTVAAR